jgi:hypothetical protein
MRITANLRSKVACVGRVFTVALRWRFGVRFAGCTLFTALLLHTTCLTTYAQIWGLKGPDSSAYIHRDAGYCFGSARTALAFSLWATLR